MSQHDEERPDVGNVGEEAAKLFGALSAWARESSQAGTYAASAGETAQKWGQGWGNGLADAFAAVNEHVATGGDDCRFCPVCQVIHVVRETSPEVREHLTVAANALVQAAAGLLATPVPRPDHTSGVEKIDLTDDTPWEDER